MTRIAPFEGEIWRHNKSGNLYQIVAFALQESDNLTVVVYKSLKDSRVWTRPAYEFLEGLEDGYRFEKVDNPSGCVPLHSALSELDYTNGTFVFFGFGVDIFIFCRHSKQ